MSILSTFAEHGYTTRSGNRARLEIAVARPDVPRARASIIMWTRKPTPADMQELEQILGAEMKVERGPNLDGEGSPERVHDAMKAFFAKQAR